MKTLNPNLPDEGGNNVCIARLLHLPHKILSHHDMDGLAQMVLHELGHHDALSLQRAGYFIDNPDFDCLKGVAGYCSDECKMHKEDVWGAPETFEQDMKDAQFHHQLKTFFQRSLPRKNGDEVDEEAVRALGTTLGMKNPSFITWKMKHGNNGLLLFEDDNNAGLARRKDLLHNFAALLSLC